MELDLDNMDQFDNLVLNLASGLKPKNLSKEEVQLLTNELGENWFEKLGYDDTFERPTFSD